MKNTCYPAILAITIFTLLFPTMLFGQNSSNGNILKELDKIIQEKETYTEKKTTQLSKLKRQLAFTENIEEHYRVANKLFQQYLHFQADSAWHYLSLKEKDAAILKDQIKQKEVIIDRAEVMGVMGMYSESLNELNKIAVASLPDQLKEYYYSTLRTCYGWMADYTINGEVKKKYEQQICKYRDSAMCYCQSQSMIDIQLAERMIRHKKPRQAIKTLHKLMEQKLTPQEKAYTCFTLYLAYALIGDREKEIYYLAQTAIIDITTGVREYASLQKLAYRLFLEGDMERAFKYLNCSMQDAVKCNARLRFLEVTEIYPIIDKAYTDKAAQKREMRRVVMITVSIVSIILIFLSGYLYFSIKKLIHLKKKIEESNEKLQAINSDLSQAGKLKEKYIAQYLERCVRYIDKFEQYRRSLEKLAMASRVEELYNAIRSEDFIKEERKDFYQEFDRSFLELFPNYIEDFNKLMKKGEEVFPKPGELLNTELRIFALIRIGIADSNNIAHFLGYSLTTVYNYRSKLRNRAKDKDNFEKNIMSLENIDHPKAY